MTQIGYSLYPIGFIRSPLKHLEEAPRQGSEGAPDVWIELIQTHAAGLGGLAVGAEIIVITWFHQARRDTLKVHPPR